MALTPVAFYKQEEQALEKLFNALYNKLSTQLNKIKDIADEKEDIPLTWDTVRDYVDRSVFKSQTWNNGNTAPPPPSTSSPPPSPSYVTFTFEDQQAQSYALKIFMQSQVTAFTFCLDLLKNLDARQIASDASQPENVARVLTPRLDNVVKEGQELQDKLHKMLGNLDSVRHNPLERADILKSMTSFLTLQKGQLDMIPIPDNSEKEKGTFYAGSKIYITKKEFCISVRKTLQMLSASINSMKLFFDSEESGGTECKS